MAQFFVCLHFTKYFNRFSKLFTVRIRRKFVIILSLITPHLECVVTLPYVSVLKATKNENIGQWRRRLECDASSSKADTLNI